MLTKQTNKTPALIPIWGLFYFFHNTSIFANILSICTNRQMKERIKYWTMHPSDKRLHYVFFAVSAIGILLRVHSGGFCIFRLMLRYHHLFFAVSAFDVIDWVQCVLWFSLFFASSAIRDIDNPYTADVALITMYCQWYVVNHDKMVWIVISICS